MLVRPVRFQSTAPTTNAYPSGSDWAPRSHRGPVEKLSPFLDSRHGDATLGRKFSNGRLSTWRCTATLARLRKSSAGRRVASPNRCLRQHRRRRGPGPRVPGMAMPAGKDAVGGVASGVDLGGQALKHASVNVWRLGPDASERSCRGHGTTFHDQLRKCDSAEEEQLASEINSVLVIRLSATPSATSIAGAKRGYQAAARPGHCDRDRSLVGQLSQLRAQQRSFATRRAAILRLGLALAGMRIEAGSGERSRPHRGMIVGS